LEGFLEILVDIFKVFVYLLQKSLKLGKVSSQAILCLQCFHPPLQYPSAGFTHKLAFLVCLVDLAEIEGASRNPTKTIEFSPQVTQFFNVIGFLEILRSFMGFVEVKLEILRAEF